MKIKSLVDHTVAYLEELIIKGKLNPGQKIKEQDIADRLGISRPPLREAFKILEADGLIRREPRRGVFVAELKEADIWEIYTLKLALYSLAVSLAVDKLKNGDIEKLEKIVRQMENVLQANSKSDVLKYEELNNQFHETTAAIAGHGRLRKIHQSLNNQIKRMAYRSFADPNHLKESCEYHRKIVEAMKSGKKSLAEKLTREHILRGLEVQERIGKQEIE